MARKRRVDELLVARGLYPDRASAERALRAGEVRLADAHKTRLEKPGQLIEEDCAFERRAAARFVSRGGDKLAGALADFSYEVAGLRCIDVGASTGGFTDCLLQAGAACVVALDVAYGIIDWKLRVDRRVRVVERRNIRTATAADLKELGAPFDLLVADLSFISLTTVFGALQRCVNPTGEMLLLVKPQFEAARGEVGRGGVVRDAQVQRATLERLEETLRAAGATVRGWSYSPLKGAKGNIEFWLWVGAHDSGAPCDNKDRIVGVVSDAHQELD